MTTATNDGGSAFPQVESDNELSDKHAGGWSHAYSYGGMSLRDYFAGQALAGLCANGQAVGRMYAHPQAAYFLADAMLRERAK